MSIRNENKERWNDPADQNEPTGIRGLQIVYALEKNKGKEVEKTASGAKVTRTVMGEVISSELKEGMVFYTNEYKEEQNRGIELGE